MVPAGSRAAGRHERKRVLFMMPEILDNSGILGVVIRHVHDS